MKIYLYIKALSDFSSRMQFIAVTSLLVSIPHASLYLMVYFIARQIAGMIASPLAGFWADRYSRRFLMIAGECLSAAALSVLFITLHPYAIITAAFLLGITYTVFDVSFRAALPNMAGEDQVISINALLVRLSSIISIAGFALGGIVVHLSSYKVLILLDMITYILSATVLMKVKWKGAETQTSIMTGQGARRENLCIVLKDKPILTTVLAASFLYPLSASAYQYALPLLADETKNPGIYNGLLWSSVALGSFFSSLFTKKPTFISINFYIMTLSAFAFSIIAAYGWSFSWWTFVLLGTVGFFEGRYQTYHYSLLQQTDETVRGRLFGVQSLNTRLGYFAGFLLTPVAAKTLSISLAVILFQAVLMAGLLSAFIIHRRFGHR